MNVKIETEDKISNAIEKFKKVKNSTNEKFTRIDDWLEKEANLYLGEIKEKKEKKYRHYKRGTLIKADFGVNPGSELCHTHFAIVINNDDNIKKDSITVIPLTSKPGVGRVPLNNLIKDQVINNIKKKLDTENLTKEDITNIIELANFYKKYTNFSYAVVSQITTISKSRIIFSNNKFDIINKARCSDIILQEIDNTILNTMTGVVTIPREDLKIKE